MRLALQILREQPSFHDSNMLDLNYFATTSYRAASTLSSHVAIEEYLRAAVGYDMLIIPNDALEDREIISMLLSMQGSAKLHVFCDLRFIGVENASLDDMTLLARIGVNVLMRRAFRPFDVQQDDFGCLRSSAKLFHIFFETGSPLISSGLLQNFRQIGFVEFLASPVSRLAAYPSISTFASHGTGVGQERMHVVVILDLVQDFEVLRPLITRCTEHPTWSNIFVAVSDRVMTSHLWSEISMYLNVMWLRWFKPISPIDVVAALGTSRSVLLTASESSVNGHKFSHTVCQLASHKTLKITVQHGYECVGLRHHQAHDTTLPDGVRFASDIVLTWSSLDQLNSIHASDRNKCIPVGVIKSTAQESALDDHIGQRLMKLDVASTSPANKVLVAENLHSVRFVDANRYQRFLDFITGLHNNRSVSLTLRSHPSKRTLERDAMFDGFAFLKGSMRAVDFQSFDAFVSPPSTILLDAVLAGVPTAVWSTRRALGDCENYAYLPVVNSADDIESWLTTENSRDTVFKNYRWALDNLCAVNGIPQAWSRMNELLFSA